MPISGEDERELKVNLMQTQIELYKAQLRWEPWKALAATVAAAAVFLGGVLAAGNWIYRPTQIIFQPGSIVVSPAPAPAK